MWRIVVTAVSMVVSGAATFGVTMLCLMELGMKLHNNYEYYGHYRVLVLGPAAIGFLAPGIVVWYLDRRGVKGGWKVAGTLALMVVSGIATYSLVVLFCVELLRSLLEGNDNPYAKYLASVGVYGLYAFGFLAPGVVVWFLHRRKVARGRSQ